MQELTLPYIASTKHAKVVWADDTVIGLFDTHLIVSIDAIEESPKDMDDLALGMEERKRCGTILVLKSSITAVEYGWCEDCKCHDITIFASGLQLGYNCSTKGIAKAYAETITNWLTS